MPVTAGFRYTFSTDEGATLRTELVTNVEHVDDNYCRDHEVDFADVADPEHMRCSVYHARFREVTFESGRKIHHDEILDRHGYCALHAIPTEGCVNGHDHCKHGVYVGGCGADVMCGRCEMGDDDEVAA